MYTGSKFYILALGTEVASYVTGGNIKQLGAKLDGKSNL
jgi:hypothetical protein